MITDLIIFIINLIINLVNLINANRISIIVFETMITVFTNINFIIKIIINNNFIINKFVINMVK